MGLKILSAACYFFGVPSLYIILSDSRKVEESVRHAAQAYFLWLTEIGFLLFIRLLLFWLNGTFRVLILGDYLFGIFWFFMGLNLVLGILVILKIEFRLPWISDLAQKVV
jgi:hypothetical protein